MFATVFGVGTRVCFVETSLRLGGRKLWIIDENFTIARIRRFHGCRERGSDEYSSYKSKHCSTDLMLTGEGHPRGSVHIVRLIFVPSDNYRIGIFDACVMVLRAGPSFILKSHKIPTK